MCWHKIIQQFTIISIVRQGQKFDMTQRQIINHKSNNLLVLIGSTRVLPEIILKFRHLKYRRSVIVKSLVQNVKMQWIGQLFKVHAFLGELFKVHVTGNICPLGLAF